MRAPLVAGLLALLLCSGCAEESVDPAPLPDAGTPDDAGPTPDAGKPSPPPLAPEREPEPFAVPVWMTTNAKTPNTSDPVRVGLEKGTFTLPPEGKRDDGTWKATKPNENGGVGKPSTGVLYAAAEVDVPAGHHLVARADTVLSVWTDNTSVQPGDIYASGRIRVPAVTRDGKHLVVVRGLGGRGEVQVQLASTPDELVFNFNDATTPDLVEGDTGEQWLGVPILNAGEVAALDLKAKVEASEQLEATEVAYPSLPAGAVTQVAFRLTPKAAIPPAGGMITVALRLESDALNFSYRREIKLGTVAKGATFKRTLRSAIDGSAQYYGVVPPTDYDPAKSYALALTLHGASVEGIGQAQAYSPKDWAFVVAPTNRRPYGFDWESWGRLDAIEVLDHAMASYPIDPTRVYLTGHSMGGHGTWNVGVLFPGRFAVVGPSAGWSSYYSYAGLAKPTGPFTRSQAPSDTLAYVDNLAKRGVYIVHGTADDNVPIAEAYTMFDAVKLVTDDVQTHWQEGAGHWWDGDLSPGADCVDWPPLFDSMKARTLDPYELDFTFTTPGPWVNAKHSFVTVKSQASAWADSGITSARAGDTVTLTTTNVRSLELAGSALKAAGVAKVIVDGAEHAVSEGPIAVGPAEGKRPGVHGPINEVFYKPFCFAWADDAPAAYARYAAFVLSSWQVNGNGHGCALPLSQVTDALRSERNIVYLGVPLTTIAAAAGLPVSWDGTTFTAGGKSYETGAMAVVFPEGDRLSGAVMASPGSEYLLYRLQPLRPVSSPPDFMLWSEAGVLEAGFFDPTWKAIEAPPAP